MTLAHVQPVDPSALELAVNAAGELYWKLGDVWERVPYQSLGDALVAEGELDAGRECAAQIERYRELEVEAA